MQHHRANAGSKVWKTWHQGREDARQNAESIDEFSPQEQEKLDLDTADIDGREHPERFEIDGLGDSLSDIGV